MISPALSPALREARFDDGGGGLDAAGVRAARSAAAGLRPADRAAASPSARCRLTAEALGLSAEPDVVRALLVSALGLPEPAFWRLDVRPLTAVELSGRAGRWNLRVGTPLAADS
ncbi:hypothetical protein [Streptomyces sp. MBT97]|uniref:hypothetical protein n=1 Tax=Streptomyces sp. MBT97 TaxID=2800411 RepID=UPI001F3737F9|nr:hypothetical protein [Streptomyces sp. MBT97]